MSEKTNPNLIWPIAELLRGDYKQSDYGKVILPFTLLRRLDCVLAPTRAKVNAAHQTHKSSPQGLRTHALEEAAGQLKVYTTSKYDFAALLDEPSNIRANVQDYINGLSDNARDIFERYEFENQLNRLDGANLLYLVVQKFAAVDLSPRAVSNTDMGLIFEELIRRFAELSNETAGEHYTPREVIALMVDLLFEPDDETLTKSGIIKLIYDPAAGTGGMLSVAQEHLGAQNPNAILKPFGQELNPESYAICKADMLLKGEDVGNIAFGNTLSEDGHGDKRFDYMLSNPPFGVEWKKIQESITKEHKVKGHNGRFGAGLPRVSDGSLIFLMHLLSKMKPADKGGSRIAIVLNGSPLFTGAAESGESNIRKWIIEQDWLEAIIALPTDMFYNTGISTYIWVLSNRKSEERRGQVQLINGGSFYQKMRKSLGSKRRELGQKDIEHIVKLYADFKNTKFSKLLPNSDFGYRTVTVERPLRLRFQMTELTREIGKDLPELRPAIERLFSHFGDAEYDDWNKVWEECQRELKGLKPNWGAAEKKLLRDYATVTHSDAAPVIKKKGDDHPYEPDSNLRDTENVPLGEEVETYFKREVLPHVSDAWIDESKTKIGYEIPFTRHFYEYKPPRELETIDVDLKAVNADILKMLQEVVA